MTGMERPESENQPGLSADVAPSLLAGRTSRGFTGSLRALGGLGFS